MYMYLLYFVQAIALVAEGEEVSPGEEKFLGCHGCL